ncbi:MAG: mechanosensitive ion channel family protein [Polyangia bacterium]
MDIQHIIDKLRDSALPLFVLFGTRLLGAIALWICGRLVIRGVRRLVRVGSERRHLDPTLIRYIDSALNTALQILLIVAILGLFGVETATFAGLFAAAGVAIGMAWSGLLSNFAAGVFMMVLRPFQAGDFITAGGVTGDVVEIGLFVTCINTPDNVRTYVGNAKIFGDTIQNFSANDFRRVELTAQLAHGIDPQDAIRRLRERLAQIPNVVKDPAPQVELVSFTLAGPVLAVRPFTHNRHYWDVYFATNLAIAEEFEKAAYPVPETHHFHRQLALPAGKTSP